MKVIQRCVYDKEFTHLAISETYNNRMNLQMLYWYKKQIRRMLYEAEKMVCMSGDCMHCVLWLYNVHYESGIR